MEYILRIRELGVSTLSSFFGDLQLTKIMIDS